MPYIPKADRVHLEMTHHANNAGELNFLLTTICLDYVDRHKKNYKTINEIVGALECAKLEFYRRLAAPYENGKMVANGDLEQYTYHAEAR